MADSGRESDHRAKVLAVDDDPTMLKVVSRALGRKGYQVKTFAKPALLLAALDADDSDAAIVLTDIHMPDMDGFAVLRAVDDKRPDIPVVFMTGQATVESAVEAMKLGAQDYLVKPFQPIDMLALTVERALEYQRLVDRNKLLESWLPVENRFGDEIIGSSGEMREVFSLIESVADVDVPVLVLGESGTGKELVARAIHHRSERRTKPFFAINCGALSESVLESELFGHVQGAFTGAVKGRKGLFEDASGSTLLLDEVGELPPSMQVKLLRTLQEGEVRPVGSNETRSIDVRIIAATHRDLAADVKEGSFRQDLYYRLNVVAIDIPPLRKRQEDIAKLAFHFIRKHAAKMHRPAESLDDAALEQLCRYHWPGNVRELENVIARAVVLTRDDTITSVAFPPEIGGGGGAAPTASAVDTSAPLSEARSAFEAAYLERVLTSAQGNVAEAARLAGLDPSNLRRVLKRHGLEPNDYREG